MVQLVLNKLSLFEDIFILKYYLANLDPLDWQLPLRDLIKSPLFITLFPNSEKILHGDTVRNNL